MGLNFQLYPKYNQLNKRTNIAILFDDLVKLRDEGKISMNPNVRELLQADSTKSRPSNYRGVLTRDFKEAAKQLRKDESVVIRKADKAATYVILTRDEYLEKCQRILSNHFKFQPINKNTTAVLKKKLNNLISAANAQIGGIKFERIIWDYSPRYFYGNVKTHKTRKSSTPHYITDPYTILSSSNETRLNLCPLYSYAAFRTVNKRIYRYNRNEQATQLHRIFKRREYVYQCAG